MMSSTLSLSGISKSFGGNLILNNLNLDVVAGEFVSILGSSGSGKTTALRLIAGFDGPDEGEITIGDRVVARSAGGKRSAFIAPEMRRVGFVPQDAALFPHLSVSDNVAFGLQGLSKVARVARVAQVLALVQMKDFGERMPEQLSGGQRHRVALARALAPEPALVLLDEPFAALDPELKAQVRDEMRRALDLSGSTTILVTHDQEEALSIADRVAVLREGSFAQIGEPREIYAAPNDIALATFLGDSVIIEGRVVGDKVETALGSLTPLNKATDGARGKVAIRPENFYLQPNATGPGLVVGRQFFGHDAMVEVEIHGIKIQARANGPFAPEVGMRMTVWVRGAVNFYAD